MVLNVNAEFPQCHTYVLKLRRAAAPVTGGLSGRLEHVATGHQCDFNSIDELLSCLAAHASPADPAAGKSGP